MKWRTMLFFFYVKCTKRKWEDRLCVLISKCSSKTSYSKIMRRDAAFQDQTRWSPERGLNSVFILFWTGDPKVLSSLNVLGFQWPFPWRMLLIALYREISSVVSSLAHTALHSYCSGSYRMRPSASESETGCDFLTDFLSRTLWC